MRKRKRSASEVPPANASGKRPASRTGQCAAASNAELRAKGVPALSARWPLPSWGWWRSCPGGMTELHPPRPVLEPVKSQSI